MNKNEIIKVKVQKIAYFKADSSWYILNTDRGSALGVVPFEVKIGDYLELEGFFRTSTFNGAQEFVFKTALISIPEDSRALLTYAVSLTKGLGTAKEFIIWEQYGENWKDTEWLDIPGINEEILFDWQDTLKRLEDQKTQTQAISFLLGKEASLTMANAAFKEWKDKTISIVNADCYALAELPHYGFQSIDEKIRLNFGIQDRDIRRVSACILYLMNSMSREDGTRIDRVVLLHKVAELILNVSDLFEKSISNLITANKIVTLGRESFSLYKDWKEENIIWKHIA